MRTPAAVLLALVPALGLAAGAGLRGSQHDLSAFGPGPIRATSESDPCIFCHVSHRGRGGALNNRPETQAKHRPYESSTMSARPGAPTGATRICLSCHDGTIAVGETVTRRIATTHGAIPAGRPSNLGTDLRKTHPVSFRPKDAAKTRAPHRRDAVQLDGAGELQCTSCHDPHREDVDPLVRKFLVKPSQNSGLCLTCHDTAAVAPPGSSHAAASAGFGPEQGNTLGYASVAEAGCRACHRPHAAEPSGRILAKPEGDDDALCLRCHAAPVTRRDVGRDWSKPHAHGREEKGVHDAAEGRAGAARRLPELSPGASRHAACVDCHDPHAAQADPSPGAPIAPGALAGMWGVDENGARVDRARFEFEVCFKCHADSGNKPAPPPTSPAARRSARGDGNLRLELGATAISAHPVVTSGRNPDVPSLKAPYAPGSRIFCGDCHASDSGPGAGGTGAAGPHGSVYPALLERALGTQDFTVESPAAYALCYKCHERDVLLSSRSAFPLHRLHVVEESAPCSTCHTPHGVAAQYGTPDGNAHLIDFDTSIVGRAGAVRRYRSDGPRRGSCQLTCHGETHDATHAYDPTRNKP